MTSKTLRPLGWLVMAVLTTLFVGCGDDAKSKVDANSDLMSIDADGDRFTCGPPNDIGIGAVCTFQGGECKAFNTPGLLCSCDVLGDAQYCACSKFCAQDSACGTGARCCPIMYMTFSDNICVSMGCLQNDMCPVVDGGV